MWGLPRQQAHIEHILQVVCGWRGVSTASAGREVHTVIGNMLAWHIFYLLNQLCNTCKFMFVIFQNTQETTAGMVGFTWLKKCMHMTAMLVMEQVARIHGCTVGSSSDKPSCPAANSQVKSNQNQSQAQTKFKVCANHMQPSSRTKFTPQSNIVSSIQARSL